MAGAGIHGESCRLAHGQDAVLEPLGIYIRQWPRTAAALAFGGVTMAVTHFAWLPEARMSGLAPALTIAAGGAHALAASITGRRRLDETRTRTSMQAGLVGAATSLLAVVLFAPAFALFLSRDVHSAGMLSYLLLAVFTGIFSFLGVGWALLVASVAVGWGLHRIAASRDHA